MKKISYVSNKQSFDSLPIKEKYSQATARSQFNRWSLTIVGNVPLTRLPVFGDTTWRSETRTFTCLQVLK